MRQVDLQLEDNSLEVYINGDPSRNIVFNPSSMGFVEDYIALVNFAKTAQKDPKYMSEVKEQSGDLDEMVDSLELSVAAHKLFYTDLCEKVDNLFGTGASQKATQGQMDLDIIIKLLTGLSQHIDKAQKDRVQKYVGVNRAARRATDEVKPAPKKKAVKK
jgi:hypothetical protein